jgi:hypothetical protein
MQNTCLETGDFIRPPQPSAQTLQPPGIEQPEEKDESKEKEGRPKKKRERQRKISRQSTKELTRQVSF